MCHTRPLYIESTISFLSCPSEEYWSLYEGPCNTDNLAETVLIDVIRNCAEKLRHDEDQYQLDSLVYGMLREAPHPSGKRYVAISLQIAYTRGGEELVVKLVQAWMDKLFLPLLAVYGLLKIERQHNFNAPRPSGYTSRLVQPAVPSSILATQVSKRERHRCAIMKVIDKRYFTSRFLEGIIPEIPRVQQGLLNVAHIIPFTFTDDDINIAHPEPCFTDFFQAWTGLDQRYLNKEKIDSPANAILLDIIENYEFMRFKSYFDKQAFPDSPNKYRLQLADPHAWLSDATRYKDVEFPSFAESGIEPPDPALLQTHAAFTKVLYQCGVAEYYDTVELESDSDIPDSDLDDRASAMLLRCRLAALTS